MSNEPTDILACIDWIAHGIEIVQSHFRDWRFQAPDAIADVTLQVMLLVGEPQRVTGSQQTLCHGSNGSRSRCPAMAACATPASAPMYLVARWPQPRTSWRWRSCSSMGGGYGSAFTSCATRAPDSSAPCIQPSIQTDVCSPAKCTRPSGVATWGSSVVI